MSGGRVTQEDSPGIRLPAPFYIVLALLAGFGLERLWPLPFLPGGEAPMVGYAIVGLSFLLLWRVEREFSACETDARCRMADSALITTGPFRYSRNPAYVGMGLMVVGLAVTFDNLWLVVLLVPAFLLVYRFCVSKEEAYLDGKFGEDYRRYRAAVRRWL